VVDEEAPSGNRRRKWIVFVTYFDVTSKTHTIAYNDTRQFFTSSTYLLDVEKRRQTVI
jgi:hypothetical protein